MKTWAGNRSGWKYNTRLAYASENSSWSAMMHRCYDSKRDSFKYYGGAGIEVCKRLHDGPKQLIECIGNRPKGMSIDRIRIDGHYSCGQCDECCTNNWPLNIRWATHHDQMRNRKNTRFISILGKRYVVQDLANHLGFNHGRVHWWWKMQWSESKIISYLEKRGLLNRIRA